MRTVVLVALRILACLAGALCLAGLVQLALGGYAIATVQPGFPDTDWVALGRIHGEFIGGPALIAFFFGSLAAILWRTSRRFRSADEFVPAASGLVPSHDPVAGPAYELIAGPVALLEPEPLIRAFIADHEAWSRFAWRAFERDRSAGLTAAEVAYRVLLSNYCPPDLEARPVALSAAPVHAASEQVVRVEYVEDACLVTTRGACPDEDFEYVLQRASGRWFLTSVLCVRDDGRDESL